MYQADSNVLISLYAIFYIFCHFLSSNLIFIYIILQRIRYFKLSFFYPTLQFILLVYKKKEEKKITLIHLNFRIFISIQSFINIHSFIKFNHHRLYLYLTLQLILHVYQKRKKQVTLIHFEYRIHIIIHSFLSNFIHSVHSNSPNPVLSQFPFLF